jgi:hypothetical protein
MYHIDNPVKITRGKPTDTMPSRRTVAVEIEVHSTANEREVADAVDGYYGTVKGDASIDNGERGFEINTAPASGEVFESNLRGITDALNYGAGSSVTSKCGLHVHVGTYDYTWKNWLSLLWLWRDVEVYAFGVMPRSRQSNTYCVGLRDELNRIGVPREVTGHEAKALVIATLAGIHNDRPSAWEFDTREAYLREVARYERAVEKSRVYVPMPRLRRAKPVKALREEGYSPGGSRYYAMNLQAMFQHGTVEFRLHSGTTDFAKIRNWASWCANLVDAGHNWSPDQILDWSRVRNDRFLAFASTDAQKAYWNERRILFGG